MSQTACKPTIAYSGDYNELLYLRARFYAPSTGRFITRDTWMGDVNKPMSYNKWQYVYSNPINLTDPSGQFPFWCKSLSSRLDYENCVRQFYHLSAPRDYSVMPVQEGVSGCWAGPVAYRAPGYVEGFAAGFQSTPGISGGKELVYDFARMERETFGFLYLGIADQLAFSGNVYSGVLLGFNNVDTMARDYQGEYWFASGGVGTDFPVQPIGLGTGATYVTSIDHKIWGLEWYFSLGASLIDPIPVVDIEVGWGKSVHSEGSNFSYVMANGRVNKALLLADIITGIHIPASRNPSGEFGMRAIGAVLALQYSMIYEEIYVNSY